MQNSSHLTSSIAHTPYLLGFKYNRPLQKTLVLTNFIMLIVWQMYNNNTGFRNYVMHKWIPCKSYNM